MKNTVPARMLALLCALAYAAPTVAGAGQAAAVQSHTDSLAWLAGHWCMATATGLVEEFWLPESGGLLLGISRTVKDGKATGFEFLRIETSGETLRFIAQPGGVPPTVFTSTRVAENRFEVQNPEHDFPQKIVYRREGEALLATISGPGADGQEQGINFTFQACKP